MARILFINSVCYGSTGNICKSLYKLAEANGHTCCIAYGRGAQPEGFNTIKIGNRIDVYKHAVQARLFDSSGFHSKKATSEFIKKIEQFKPDVIHLHNVHGYYLNIEILFEYLKKNPNIKKVWTIHDCWPYTGHCAYYLNIKCNKWKNKCEQCQFKNEYPRTIKGNSEENYALKKKIFTGIANMEVVCVSEWLKGEVEQSFLKEYECQVIISGVDTSAFSYKPSDVKERLGIVNKTMILGVASVWSERKGLQDFLRLRKQVSEEYVIVLIGVSKKQQKKLPKGIIGIRCTENQEQLREFYSAADIFFNPTREETYGLTNVEAQLCGTTTISYDAGGTRETIISDNSYLVKNFDEMLDLLKVVNIKRKTNEINLEKVDRNRCLRRYLELY